MFRDARLCTTTHSIDGNVVASYRGIVASQVIFGVSAVRDLASKIVDVIGGRSAGYEEEFERARRTALADMVRKAEALKANAIVCVRFDYQLLGQENGMIMVAASGTAVQLTKSDEEREKDEERAAEDVAACFVVIAGAEKGPFSILQLRELIAAGRVEESDRVRVDGREATGMLRELLQR